jgi:hypothetical protein
MALTACGGEKPPIADEVEDKGDAQSIEEMRAAALAKIDVEACRAGGGEVRQEGLMGLPRCVTPYADVGKACRDGDDCLGRCLADETATDFDAAPGEVTGVCEADDSPFGCYGEIEDGRYTGFFCVD